MVDSRVIVKWILWIAGFMIIFGTHLVMIVARGLPPDMVITHSIANMIAGILIIVGNGL